MGVKTGETCVDCPGGDGRTHGYPLELTPMKEEWRENLIEVVMMGEEGGYQGSIYNLLDTPRKHIEHAYMDVASRYNVKLKKNT